MIFQLISLIGRCIFIYFAYDCAASSKYGNYLFIEMLLLTTFLTLCRKYYKILAIPLILIHVLQFTNVILTGYWIDPNTLQNLSVPQTIGNQFHLAAIIGLSYILCWIPSFFSKYEIYFNRHLKFLAICLSLSFLIVSSSSVRHFGKSASEAWSVISFKISNNQEIKDLFIRDHNRNVNNNAMIGRGGGRMSY